MPLLCITKKGTKELICGLLIRPDFRTAFYTKRLREVWKDRLIAA